MRACAGFSESKISRFRSSSRNTGLTLSIYPFSEAEANSAVVALKLTAAIQSDTLWTKIRSHCPSGSAGDAALEHDLGQGLENLGRA